MANKVFLLVNGTMDAREVIAAFSTRAAADAALPFGGSWSEIEEVELDPSMPAGPDGHTLWYVMREINEEPQAGLLAYCDVTDLDQVKLDGDTLVVELWAADEEHALKLGVERIEQFMKEQGLGE